MIAMTLGLVLTAGVSQLFVGNKQASALTHNLGYMQENIRIANHFLGDSIRLSGHWGGIEDIREIDTNTGAFTVTALGNCNETWSTNVAEGLRGLNGATTSPSNCLSNYKPDSDILLVRYADSTAMIPDSGLTSAGDQVFVRASISDLGHNVRFIKAADGVPTDMTKQLSTFNMPLRAHMFYIKTCSQQAPDGTCRNTTPALARITLNGLTVTDQVLVEGVEQLQVEYGIDSDGDGTANTYSAAGTSTDWNQVISARYSFLVRSQQQDAGHSDTRTYNLSADTNSFDPAAADEKYYRKLITQTVQLKNKF